MLNSYTKLWLTDFGIGGFGDLGVGGLGDWGDWGKMMDDGLWIIVDGSLIMDDG